MIKKIMISRQNWDEIVKNSVPDNKNSLKVPGHFSAIFQKDIRKIENSQVTICFKHARIYKQKLKTNSNFFICDAIYSICRIKYSIKLER